MMDRGFLLRQAAAHIENHGWHCVGVFGTADDPPLPNYTYSVGFREHDEHPEMIVVGLPNEIAQSILWGIYDRIKDGERFEDGDTLSGIIENYSLVLRAVPPDGRPLNMARAYYNLDELPALQVLWPDVDGNFPGEEAVDPEYEGGQALDGIRAFDIGHDDD